MEAREREKRWIVAPHRCGGRTGGGRRGRLPMGAVLPAAIQTLSKIKIEKDGARECIICCDNMEVREEATPLPYNH